MQILTSLFLSQSYKDTWKDYKRSLSNANFACWDYVILTASNERQAAAFTAQIEERKKSAFLPSKTEFAVIPDPDGIRVGSGGATLGVIRYIAEREGRQDFKGLRILVIHSGGDSKRVPQYSALGKLFSPVPRSLPNGRSSTLFDELMICMSSVPARIKEGMLVLSGDVLLLFNPLLIDFSGSNAAAISFKEHVETGKNHGVFLRGKNGNVAKFLHKQTVQSLSENGAVDQRNQVDIDTGAIIFSPDILRALFSLISVDGKFSIETYNKFVNNTVRLSLYGDFLYPLAEDSTLESFYKEAPEGEFSDALTDARTAVWNALRPYQMKLFSLAPAKFVHFGTTGEILHLMTSEITDYKDLDWTKHVNSAVTLSGVSGYNSILSDKATIGENCYLEVSYVHSKAIIGNNVLLSYIDIHDEQVPSDVVIHGLKQLDGKFVARIYGINDNPKNTLQNGCTLFGISLDKILSDNGITESELWETSDRSLWSANLYPACATVKEAVAAALNIYNLAHGCGDVKVWRNSERKSLASGFIEADSQAIMAWNSRMAELVSMENLLDSIRTKKPVSEIDRFTSASLTDIQKRWLEEKVQETDFSNAMRLYFYIGSALDSADGDRYTVEAFKCLQRAILENTLENISENKNCKIVTDSHTVKLPLRINWGGGWSDTPPYCIENGGTVLNAAILLDGEKPVSVTLERTDDYKIVFDSRDMDVHGEFETIEPLQDTGDPYNPFALQKAALLACGIIPAKGGNLKEILKRLGGGFIMNSEVTGVPKGSGLGTSSILSAACVKALFEFTGINYTQEDLYSHVLCMEQIMSTGGGWQDQVGGLTEGIKYAVTKPGLYQQIHVEHINLSEETKNELNNRFVLIYTGQRRLARNILRDVVGRYIGNESDSLYALGEIQKLAALMRFELERDHVDDFAQLLNRHWELSQMIDAGSTNIIIDQIFASIEDLIDARMVCGAGGGGFLQAILKNGVTKAGVHARLKSVFGDTDIDVWNCQLI